MATLENALRISDIPRYWAHTTPAATALVENGVVTSFGELWAGVTAGADVLRKQGVGAGDRVMLIGENCASQIALIFSLSELGAWPVIVNARLSEREVETIRAHCKPRLMVFSHLVSPEAAKH